MPRNKRKNSTEVLKQMEQMDTQSRKGVQLPRMGVRFTPSNYIFLRRLSDRTGEPMSHIINKLIAGARDTVELFLPEEHITMSPAQTLKELERLRNEKPERGRKKKANGTEETDETTDKE